MGLILWCPKLRPGPIGPVSDDTARVARAAFPKGYPYLTLADELGTVCTDEKFAALFPTQGQPALVPWRLALVSILQFAEGLSDRQVADAVRSRIDWKYVLRLDLADAGFDASVLTEFRARLRSGDPEQLLAATRTALSEAAFAEPWSAGQALSLEQATALAQETLTALAGPGAVRERAD